MAEGGWLRPAIARGDRHVPLQGHHRQQPTRPDLACAEDRGQDRLLGAQPADPPRQANVAARPLKTPRAGTRRSLSDLCIIRGRPPLGKGKLQDFVTRGRMLPSVRPLVRRHAVAGLHGSSRTGSTSTPRAQGTLVQPGCPDPVSPTVAPCPPSVRPTPSRPCSAYAVTAGARYTPPLTSRAQTMRAILLARATVTSIFGLRASMRASHEPCGAPR